MEAIPNVLAQRYAGSDMRRIWSQRGKIRLEREYWIAVLKAQVDLGLPVDPSTVQAYEKVIDDIDLDAIEERERVTRHDVKARIEAFNESAGAEQIHKGMTSRDLTENVEQLQLYRAARLLLLKATAVLHQFATKAQQWEDMVITARTHNVAAQPTTLGRRMAMYGEELLRALRNLQHALDSYPARGLKGAVGTQLDQLTLLDQDPAKVRKLEKRILQHLGLPGQWIAAGQVYPRSLDAEILGHFVQLASAPANFAQTLRLMAGHELAGEGFAKGQVGSSAMPHKMNARSCERIGGFHNLLKGYHATALNLAGDQWNEGDVSCSVVRRVILPDASFALDGLLQTALTILNQMEVFPAVIARENARYFPFLGTTTLLMEAVKAGAGRESAHAAIKENALAAVHDLRAGRISRNDLAQRLANDQRLPLPAETIEHILQSGESLLGNAKEQINAFAHQAVDFIQSHPEATAYTPEPIL